MSTIARAPVKRLQGIPGAGGARNKGLQLVEQWDVIPPRQPETARKAAEAGTSEADFSFRRPLQSARGRLETHQDVVESRGTWSRTKAAGGRPGAQASRGITTQNTGKGYSKPSIGETRWGVDVSALESSNPMHCRKSAASRSMLAFDGRRTRFQRRNRIHQEFARHQQLHQLNAAAHTPAAQRAFAIECRLHDNDLSETQRAVLRSTVFEDANLDSCVCTSCVRFGSSAKKISIMTHGFVPGSYELAGLGKCGHREQKQGHDMTGRVEDLATGAHLEHIFGTKDVVKTLFHQEGQRILDVKRLEEQLLDHERQIAEKKLLVVSVLSGDSNPLALGQQWEDVGPKRPQAGTQFKNPGLALALKAGKHVLTKDELRSFGVRELSYGSYIKVRQSYFRPVVANVNSKMSHLAQQQTAKSFKALVINEEQVHESRTANDREPPACETQDGLQKSIGLRQTNHPEIKTAATGGQTQGEIPHVELTELQSAILEKSVLRLEHGNHALRKEAVERDKEDAARLSRLKEARRNDMSLDRLRKERALERQWERERQISLKTVPETGSEAEAAAEFYKRQKHLRELLDELSGIHWQADPIHGDIHGKPVEEWDDKSVRRICADGKTSTITPSEMQGKDYHQHFVRHVSIAMDSKGRKLVADPLNHCVRRFDKNGDEEIVAGSGNPEKGGFADGTGDQARFFCPTGLAVDNLDNIYVADFYNNRIRMINSEGAVSTLAGTGERGFEDGEASCALLDHPESVAIDAKGDLYVADWGNHRICRISLQEVPKPASVAAKNPRLAKLTSKHALILQSTRTLLNFSDSMKEKPPSSFPGNTSECTGVTDTEPDPPVSELLPEKKWYVSTFAGSGHRGFKDAIGEAARFNHPHGIFVEDEGTSIIVLDSQLDTAHKPADNEDGSRLEVEAEKRRLDELQHQADMDECASLLRDNDFVRMGPQHLKSQHERHLDDHTLGRLWRWSAGEAEKMDTVMAHKIKSMRKGGMMLDKDIAERILAARKVEAFRRFHFRNVLRMLRRKEQKHIDKVELVDESNTSKMGLDFDVASMNAEALAVDERKLHSGPRQLRHFRLELSKRFNSVYDAWIFFDMDGDGSMSEKEFLSLCMPLRLPKDVSPHEIFALIWQEHRTRIMASLNHAMEMDSVREITPLNFVDVLQWHAAPSTDRELLLMLDMARDKRLKIHAMAIRRTAEQKEPARAAAAVADAQRKSHKHASQVRMPVRVPCYKLPRNDTYPHYEPVKLAAPVELPPPPPTRPPVLQRSYPLPEQMAQMNDKVELVLHNRKEQGMQRMNTYDHRVQWVGTMLTESSLHRGHVWRLRDAGDKDQASDWDEFLLVLTDKGRLMMEPTDSELLAATSYQRKMVLDFDMTTIVRHDALDIKCLGGTGMQLIFRVLQGSRRSNLFLYLAFGENHIREYNDWWNALRKFSWRVDDINTEHLGATKWKPEEKVIWDEIEDVFRARYELRKVIKMQRWWRALRQGRADHAALCKEMLRTHEQVSRMAYLLQHHGPIGEQEVRPHRAFTFSRGRFQRNYARESWPAQQAAKKKWEGSDPPWAVGVFAGAEAEGKEQQVQPGDSEAMAPSSSAPVSAAECCVRCKGVIDTARGHPLVCNAHLFGCSPESAHRMHRECAVQTFADGATISLCEKHTGNKEHLCGFSASEISDSGEGQRNHDGEPSLSQARLHSDVQHHRKAQPMASAQSTPAQQAGEMQQAKSSSSPSAASGLERQS